MSAASPRCSASRALLRRSPRHEPANIGWTTSPVLGSGYLASVTLIREARTVDTKVASCEYRL